MPKNDILRLALILGGTQVQNFKTNLLKMVKLVLFDLYGKEITVSTILQHISDKYMLEFTDSEIYAAIKEDCGIIVKKCEDPIKNLYTLTPEEYKKMTTAQKNPIDEFIKQFLTENQIPEKTDQQIKDLIYRYLYFTFNSDTKTVLNLLSKKNTPDNDYCINSEFSPEDATIINSFLNWDNESKNEYILNLLSACFDYCMLTIKKDISSFNHVFNGKVFFLDSNIIFRLAGFNKIERKTVLDAFIKKCKDAGIAIQYTNVTYSEIKSTINHHVAGLRDLLRGQQPVSINAMSALSSKYANLDFYEKYVEWCKNPVNKVGNFSAFTEYLEYEIKKIISPFKMVIIPEDYDMPKKHAYFTDLIEDFKSYKYEQYKNTYEGNIKVDITNYLYLTNINNNGQASNFLELKYYFITADHCLTEWASKKRPGTIPIFVLPSVWYSILLKYKGRTTEDYKSFCQFLNIRIAPERDPLLEQKHAMLAHILELDEESSIKEKIIFDVESRLQSNHINIEDPIQFADESHKTILQKMLDENKQHLEAQHQEALITCKNTFEEEKRLILSDLDTSHKLALDKTSAESYQKGQDDLIVKQAKRTAKTNHTIITILHICFIVFLICACIALIFSFFKNCSLLEKIPDFIKDNLFFFTILHSILSVLLKVFLSVLKHNNWLSTDIDVISKKIKETYK